jgi:putative membrane protein
MKEMVAAHEKDVALFEKQSTSGSDTELRTFAAKTLPKLREHLDMARSLNQQK